MKSLFWRIFLTPSAYGFLLWIGLLTVLLILKLSGTLNVNVSAYAWFVFLYLILCFILSTILSTVYTRSISISSIAAKSEVGKLDQIIFLTCTTLGLIGLFFYIHDFSRLLGGYVSFFSAFLFDPLVIRALAQNATSIGFQLSYFSWISIFYCAYFLTARQAINKPLQGLLLLAIIIQFALNLLFIDRTRPVILFTLCFLGFMIFGYRNLKHPLLTALTGLLVPIGMFFIHALFTGKFDLNEGLLGNFLLYVFGGFGYFSVLLDGGVSEISLARTFYPIAKIFEWLGIANGIPSQILDFHDVPFSTNVGTFLEPLYSDGGWVLIILAIPLIVFLIDFISYLALKNGGIYGAFLWSNLVLINLFSFFVPKYNAVYLYLFFGIFLIMTFLGWISANLLLRR